MGEDQRYGRGAHCSHLSVPVRAWPSTLRDKARREPRRHWFLCTFPCGSQTPRGKGTCPGSPSRVPENAGHICSKCPGFIVSPSLPGPRCLSAHLLEQPLQRPLSLCLQHPRVPRANLNLFLSCVTMVKCAANTWRGAAGRV